MFEIPIVLLMFKREKIVEIISVIEKVKPRRVYLISDGGRNSEEHKEVEKCRALAEAAITWKCEIIKNYSEYNRGVYENIAGGAKWVFQREKWAIFLEDDNLPEVTFFDFCKQMLERYENDGRVGWICGTNYLGDSSHNADYSYYFTRHMLPCGWASWSEKFIKYYDGDMNRYYNSATVKNIASQYSSTALYRQYSQAWKREKNRIDNGNRPVSWDMQMDFSIKVNNIYGICPNKNQIKNIGVDSASIHGGTSMSSEMTRRFCGMNSYSLDFPLVHPDAVLQDNEFEIKIGKIMTYPLRIRILGHLIRQVRKIFNIQDSVSTKQFIYSKIKSKG